MNFDKRAIDNGEVVNASTLTPQTLAIVSPFTEVAVSPLRRLYVGARIDYQLNSKNTLTVNYEPNLNTSRDAGIGNFTLPTQSYRTSLMEHSIKVIETMLIGTSTVNETRFQFRHQNSAQTPDSNDPSIIVSNAFNGGGSSSGLHDYIHHHYEVQNYTTKTSGAHIWKFGTRLRAVSIVDTSEQGFNGTYVFGGAYAPVLDANNQPVVPGVSCDPTMITAGCTTITSLEQYRRTLLFQQMGMTPQMIRAMGGGATQFSINTGNPIVDVGGADIGLFAGDDWKVKPNLTLSLGARYETQENIRDHSDIAPRVAFAWAPGGTAKNPSPGTVIRGGFGMFYDRFSEQNVLIAQRYNGINQEQFLLSDPDTFPAIPSESVLQAAAGTQIVHTLSSTLKAPRLLQSSMSVERQLPEKTTLAVTYTNSHGLHELRSRNINAPLNGVFPYPDEGPIYQMESSGLYNQNLLLTNVNSRLTPTISLSGSYSLAYARSNTDGLKYLPCESLQHGGRVWPGIERRAQPSFHGRIDHLEIRPAVEPVHRASIRHAVQHHHQPGYLRRYGFEREAGLRDEPQSTGRDRDLVWIIRSESHAGRETGSQELRARAGPVRDQSSPGPHLRLSRARQNYAVRIGAQSAESPESGAHHR